MEKSKHNKKTLLRILGILASVLFWILVWALAAYRYAQPIFLPSPLAAAKRLFELAAEREFWLISAGSLLRIIIGIVSAVVIGSALAVLSSLLPPASTLFSPPLAVIKATPVACFICIAYLLIKTSELPIFITALIVVPIVYTNVHFGIGSVDKQLLEVGKVYGFSKPKMFGRIYFPSVLPYFLAACRSSFGMAWKAGIAAEILAPPQNSIGYEIYMAKVYFEGTDIFAWTLTVIVLSIVTEKLMLLGLSAISKRFNVAEVKNVKD